MYTENGYFTSKAFSKYLDHFIAHFRPTKEEPALFVLDAFPGHVDVDVLEHAAQRNILIVCFPSHTAHAL
jgi:hypothetical protein